MSFDEAESYEKFDREALMAVRGFLERHPELALERFNLPPDRLYRLPVFVAVDAVAMMLRRWPRREADWRRIEYMFRRDGDVITVNDGKTVMPGSSLEGEIGNFLWEEPWHTYRAVSGGRTEEVYGREYLPFRKTWTGPNGEDLIARGLIRWIFDAVQVSPELLFRYRASRTDAADLLLLKPNPDAGEKHAHVLDAWKR